MKVLSYLVLSAFLFSATSCLKQEDGQYIPGVNGPKVNIQDGKILLTVELEKVDLQGGLTMPIRKMDHSTLTVSPSISSDGSFGGTLISIAFDLRDVENDDFRSVPNETLPDGRPFPFLIDGTLPALAINIPKAKDITLYASEKVFGFFLPINLPEDFNISVHYKIKINGKSYGIVSLIHPDERGEGAGVVALLTLDDVRSNPGLNKLLRISKRNKSRIY